MFTLNHRFSLPVLLAVLCITVITQTGCRENTLINSKISPSDSEIGVYSTSLPCITHTYYDDTAVTGLYFAGFPVYQGVGVINDPFFGTMNGATNFQLLPVNPSIAIYDNMTIDSAVLVLPYSGFTYGDTADQSLTQSYQAFFLNEDIKANTVYYSYTTKSVNVASPLSDPATVNIYHLKDSISVKGKNYHSALRLKLKTAVLLSRLLPALTAATNNPSTANAAFNDVFKGVCVRPTNANQSTKAYPFFRLDGNSDYTGAGILVYYHPNASPTVDTLSQRYFFAGESCGFLNSVTRSYSHSPVNALLTSVQANDSIIALQNQPGPNIDIVIPGLKSLPSGMINKAELQLCLLPAYKDSKFAPPARIFPYGAGNGTYPAGVLTGVTYNVADASSVGSIDGILDGRLHTFKRDGIDVETFTIDIPREVMVSRAAKNDTLHLHITGSQNFIGAFRMVAGGGNHPNPLYRAKLFVVYSSLN